MQKYLATVFSVSTAAVISVLTIIALLVLPSNIWEGWTPATCLKTGCFCESANPHKPIRQMANTVSSLAFVFSGVIVFSKMRKKYEARRLPNGYSAILGISSIIIGVGSAFYHASLTFIGQFFDVFGMFLAAAFMLVYAWERIYKLQPRTTLILYMIINAGLTWLQIAIPETRRYVFAIVLIVALAFEYYFRMKEKPQAHI
jgi:hypothetical protein